MYSQIDSFCTASEGVVNYQHSGSKLSVRLVIVSGCRRGQRLPVGFLVPVNVVPDVAWNFVHHTAPDSGVAFDSAFKFFRSLLHTKVLRSINGSKLSRNKNMHCLNAEFFVHVQSTDQRNGKALQLNLRPQDNVICQSPAEAWKVHNYNSMR